MVYSAKSAAAVISQFTRRKKLHINSTADGALTDYQIKFTITHETVMQADFDDIRFNETNGDYINSWLESKTNSDTADFWIKTDVPASGGKDIYMYYGNADLSTGSSGANTFIQYHGAATADFLDSLSLTFPYIYEAKAKIVGSSEVYFGVSNQQIAYSDDSAYILPHTGDNKVYGYVRNELTPTGNSVSPVWSSDTYKDIMIKCISNSEVICYPGDGTNFTLTTNVPNESLGLVMYETSGAGDQEYSFARKYTANEPTTSIGTQQHQRRVPQFIG